MVAVATVPEPFFGKLKTINLKITILSILIMYLKQCMHVLHL